MVRWHLQLINQPISFIINNVVRVSFLARSELSGAGAHRIIHIMQNVILITVVTVDHLGFILAVDLTHFFHAFDM